MLKYIDLMLQEQQWGDTLADDSVHGKLRQQAVQRVREHSAHANALAGVMRLWRSGVLLLDEVDMVLHPLRSELNFPIGAPFLFIRMQ